MTLRRRVLLGGVGFAALGFAGCGLLPDGDGEPPFCAARSALTGHDSLGDLPLIYEVDEQGRTFSFDTVFYDRLIDWLAFFREQTGVTVSELRTYGSWTDGGVECSSWHNAGRAFDLAGLRHRGQDVISCRYDHWRAAPAAEQRTLLRRYWATAASLHHHFRDVLTYLFDDQHLNHIHIDNGQTGPELSTFTGQSRVQIHAVQAICSHVWDRPAPIDGQWTDPTRQVVAEVTGELGAGDDLGNPETWRAFLRASTARFA
ncbi:hypothetical protein [Microlunatus speluncae]|uniref:hypothetical protein n=1 Tax=Microlunatus speluncae TaxID=2594267 RepID=UPI0012664DF0|nr:hypothetical protein [Microlunatus speluncae]